MSDGESTKTLGYIDLSKPGKFFRFFKHFSEGKGDKNKETWDQRYNIAGNVLILHTADLGSNFDNH